MVAQQTNLDVIANNLANVNTNAFKSQRAEFQDLMYQTVRASGAASGGSASVPEPAQIGLGSRFSASSTSFNPGSIQATGNATDLAIAGEGFFQIELPDGGTAYTRDGSFKVDANGLMVTADGYTLQPNITIPNGATALTITGNGTVTALIPGSDDPTVLGNIEIATFANPAGLMRVGQNLFKAGGASGAPVTSEPGQQGTGTLQQRFLEGSNVQIVEEMVRMITAQRAYEINSKMVTTSDDMLSIANGLKR